MTLHKHDRCATCGGDARVSEGGLGWLCKGCLAATRAAVVRALRDGTPVSEGICLDCGGKLEPDEPCWRCKHDEDAMKDDGRELDQWEVEA